MNFFKKNDPKKERNKKFAELEQSSDFPEMVNFEKATWLTSRGNHYGQKKKYQEAITDFNEALNLKPDHLPAHFSLAIAYKECGNKQKAIEIIKKAPNKMMLNGDIIVTKQEAMKDLIPTD